MAVDPALVAERARALRGALARIELAASQLARESGTPRARGLARVLSGAVDELDRGLGGLAALLEPRSPRASVDLRPLVDAVAERLREPLAARGIEWLPGVRSADPLPGDPELARRAVLLLLRAGTSGLAAGGRVRLDLLPEPPGFALALHLEPAAGGAAEPDASRLAALRDLLGAARGGFEHERDPRRVVLRAVFPGAAA